MLLFITITDIHADGAAGETSSTYFIITTRPRYDFVLRWSISRAFTYGVLVDR